MSDEPVVVCIVGARGSGKTTAAEFLRRHGFLVVSAGKKNRELALAQGCSPDTPSLQDFGLRLIAERGVAYFASVLAGGTEGHSRVVFEGVRSPGVVACLTHQFPTMKVVLVIAPPELRRTRLMQRGDDPHWDAHPIESYAEQYSHLGAEIVANTGDVRDFEQDLLNLVFRGA